MTLTKKILIGVVVFYLIILLLSWLIKDTDLNPDLEMKLKQNYVMQPDLNDIPEFSILGLNAVHESVIPAFGKYAYYQGWAEYYSYINGASLA